MTTSDTRLPIQVPSSSNAATTLQPRAALLVIGIASLSAALLAPIYKFGASSPMAAGAEWVLLAAVSWLALVTWAIVYSSMLQRYFHVSRAGSLVRAAICHLPLILCLVPVAATYFTNSFASTFGTSEAGQRLFQPLLRDYVIAAPLAAQLLVAVGLRWRTLVASLPILLIVFVAFALRFSNAWWGLPGLLHADEHKYIGQAIIMVARGDLHPHYFENPSLMIYVAALLFWGLTEHSIAFHTADQLFSLGIPDPRGDFFQMVALRGTVAIAGTVTVWAVYAAAKELFGRRAGLFAAALLSVAFLHVRNSHYATNDILATSFLAVSFLFAARIYTRGKLLDYILAGLLGGLATTAKYNAGFFFVPIVLAHLLRVRSLREWRTLLIGLLPLVASGIASIVGFLAGTPYALLDYPAFLEDFKNEFQGGSTLITGFSGPPVPLLYLETLWQGFGVLPLALGVVGIVIGLRSRQKKAAWLVLMPLVVLLGFMLTQALFCARFAIPMLPPLAIFAGYAVSHLKVGSAQNRIGNWLQMAVIIIAVAQPLAFTLQADRILGREDTRGQAAQWIDANTPKGTAIAMEAWAHLDNKFKWAGFEGREVYIFWAEGEKGRAKAMSGEYRYVVTSSFGYEPWQMDGAPESLVPAEYQYLRNRATLRATFAPGPGNTDLPYSQDEMYSPFWHLFDRERPGPTVRIYQLP